MEEVCLSAKEKLKNKLQLMDLENLLKKEKNYENAIYIEGRFG